MVKLILSDCDGTLINSQGKISKKNIEAIKKARDKGLIFAIATGRFRSGCREIFAMLGIEEKDMCCAYDNGSTVYVHGENIYDGSIRRNDIKSLIDFLRNENCKTVMYHKDNWIVEKKDSYYDWINEFYEGMGLVCDFDQILASSDTSPIKLSIRGDESSIKSVHKKLSEQFSQFEYYLSASNILEMNYKNRGKDNALKIIADYYKVDINDTMAIGDFDNDALMLKTAGIGVAMGNASEFAKNNAKFITLTNDDDGVAFAINKFCLNPEEEKC